jgi:hypothetical protein
MILPRTAQGTDADTVTIPLYRRTDYTDTSRKYSKVTFDAANSQIYFYLWYFYPNAIWNQLVPPVGKLKQFSVVFSKIVTPNPNPEPEPEPDPNEPEDFTQNNYTGNYTFNVNTIIPCEGWTE